REDMPRKKIELEKSENGGEFKQEPMGGDVNVGKKSVEKVRTNPYHALVTEMRNLADSIVFLDALPTKTRTFRREISEGASRRFVESMISARPVLDPGQGRDHDPSIYVHTFAVRNIDDFRLKKPLESKDEIGGYVIQIGLPEPIVFFVQTTDSKCAYRLHREIVRMSQTLNFTSNDSLANRLWDNHAKDVNERGEPLLLILDDVGDVFLSDPPYESPHEEISRQGI
ncbi:MAG: hypothetical protein Q8P56_06420, partial [Candidatus Uhrbacteria bacterium]|nr:hypothetical protein [Candidatus Uhrbacteria bacterium]